MDWQGRNGTQSSSWSGWPIMNRTSNRLSRMPRRDADGVLLSENTDTACRRPPRRRDRRCSPYTVVALDHDPVTWNLREGAVSLPATVTLLNNPPHAPTGLAASTDSDGATVLSWNAPGARRPGHRRLDRGSTGSADGTAITPLRPHGPRQSDDHVDGRNGGTQHLPVRPWTHTSPSRWRSGR